VTVRRERAAAGSTLAGALEVELWDLGMQGASVAVEMHEVELGPDGGDRVEILLAPGPGQQKLPLRKAASGGELSRTMLACRSVMADLDDVPTLVFDEVDAGIGGAAGVAVGRRLARIARDRQVLVVTHLPQIACFADRHLHVEKEGGTAVVRSLDESDRVRELSRMLAGLPSSDAASTHAEELLAQAAKEKAR
jgi:DNA repair protein RecN (Recombination protein N)